MRDFAIDRVAVIICVTEFTVPSNSREQPSVIVPLASDQMITKQRQYPNTHPVISKSHTVSWWRMQNMTTSRKGWRSDVFFKFAYLGWHSDIKRLNVKHKYRSVFTHSAPSLAFCPGWSSVDFFLSRKTRTKYFGEAAEVSRLYYAPIKTKSTRAERCENCGAGFNDGSHSR